MTANKVIEIVDKLIPNQYDEEIKLKWISELDGMVQRLVFQNDSVTKYNYPKDMDRELLIPTPFDNCYELYLETMINYYNKEYGNYNNSLMMFDARYNEYKKAYIREHRAKG